MVIAGVEIMVVSVNGLNEEISQPASLWDRGDSGPFSTILLLVGAIFVTEEISQKFNKTFLQHTGAILGDLVIISY